MDDNTGVGVLLGGTIALLVATFFIANSLSGFATAIAGAGTFQLSQATSVPSVSIKDITSGQPSGGRLPVTISYEVTSPAEILSCTLHLNSKLIATDTDIAKGKLQSFQTSQTPGKYTGQILCSDAAGNSGGQSFVIEITPEDVAEPQAPVQVCGNGVAEGTEKCDTTDFKGQTCKSLGFVSGALGCTANCELDTSNCISEQHIAQPSSRASAPPSMQTKTSEFSVSEMLVILASVVLVLFAVWVLAFKTQKTQPDYKRQLRNYVHQSLSAGYSPEQIWQTLIDTGWSSQMIEEAFREAGLIQ